MNFARNSISKWITAAYDAAEKDHARYLRATFRIPGTSSGKYTCAICGLGYYELFLNGRRIGDRVLEPAPTAYHQRFYYTVYDVTGEILPGRKNAVGVILGNGFYNSAAEDPWHFDLATWRDDPKLCLELYSGEDLVFASGISWKSFPGPIRFHSLRNGEYYDARMEFRAWTEPGFDDSRWHSVRLAKEPGGIPEEQAAEPCRVYETFELKDPNCFGVYDTHRNIAGHVRITLSGRAGETVSLDFNEQLLENGDLDTTHLAHFTKSGCFQHDEYILKGDGIEVWEPKFTYHGFRYVRIGCDRKLVSIRKVEARVVGTDFATVGRIHSLSDGTLSRIQELAVESCRANFVGIPTDCPHREKNGWTGDASIVCETMLHNFDASAAFDRWLDSMRDSQRPSGEYACIIPTPGWGYNWGNGPCWDEAIVHIPWNIYLYTGDLRPLRKNYDSIRRYIDYLERLSDGYIIQWGLGDWSAAPATWWCETDTTAAYYTILCRMTAAAPLCGHPEDAAFFRELAEEVRRAFNRKYYQGNGHYAFIAPGGLTQNATPLYRGLCEESERPAVWKVLLERLEAFDCRSMFGHLGSAFVPRVLADHGCADLALKTFTQEQFPGWGWMVRHGASGLWENWNGKSSGNHVLFADPSAWLYRYGGGFRHSAENPGWKHLRIEPAAMRNLSQGVFEYRGYRVVRRNSEETTELQVTVPADCSASVLLPDGQQAEQSPGTVSYCFSLEKTTGSQHGDV